MRQIQSLLMIGMLVASCTTNTKSDLSKTVSDYYHTYNERADVEKMLTYYAPNVVFEDIITGDRIEGKNALREFLDWDNPNFQQLDNSLLVIETIIIEEGNAAIKGYFKKFKWGDTAFEPMHFTTLLTFDDTKHITKQVDWINYPSSLVNYSERKNSNLWLPAQ
ncbi:nuclear transport factor 2 family protein [Marinoscillum sp.]|uniref:nuclear transport factor 2 family protein n=1 Tax=Marinoscillum sp. TaxID=2024838 RepID=UPI003BA84E87